MSLRQVDDLNLFLIGDMRSSFFGCGDGGGLRGEASVLMLVGMESSCGLGGRVSSSTWLLVGLREGLIIILGLGGIGSKEVMAFFSGVVDMVACEGNFSWGSCYNLCSLVGGFSSR